MDYTTITITLLLALFVVLLIVVLVLFLLSGEPGESAAARRERRHSDAARHVFAFAFPDVSSNPRQGVFQYMYPGSTHARAMMAGLDFHSRRNCFAIL